MITLREGDIFDPSISIILHSCNCWHTMGAGIAKEIKGRYPRAFEADKMTPRGEKKKMGQFSFALANEDQRQTILNCYTQFYYGRDKRYVDYDKFQEAMQNSREWILKMGMEKEIIGIPYKISCANAGGDWPTIEGILKYVFGSSCKLNVFICSPIKKS